MYHFLINILKNLNFYIKTTLHFNKSLVLLKIFCT